jgi:beta-glucanase (GH16 family)
LIIRATKRMTPGARDTRTPVTYQSARLKTQRSFCQLGGYFEARVKVDSQRGLWPAFWLMGENISTAGWPACGEVDMLEDFGYCAVQTSVHAPAGPDAVYTAHQDLASDTDWHVYQLRWAAESMTFSRDGRHYLTVNRDFCPSSAWVFGPETPNNSGMFLLLNLAVGGDAGAPPETTRFPADLMVDYVRVSGL